MPELLYIEAVNAALARALAERGDVLLYGEDVAKPGGVHGVTRGLYRRFGDRVFDTPISESAILGSAIGAALVGMRPVVEIMWADFLFVAFDQLINQAANMRYVSRGELTAPITVRTQQGTAPGACAQHSQSIEAILAHVPGIRVCLPATPQDAYDLTLAAIGCDDPTVIVDHRSLYRSLKGEVTFSETWPGIGGGRVHRPGTDVTLVSWGAAVQVALAAADRLEKEHQLSVEVYDPRWLNPLDIESIVDSVRRTGALAVLHEANRTGGFGAEIVARVLESGVRLRTAPRRLGAADTRIPAAPSLLAAVVPTVDSVVAALRDLPGRGAALAAVQPDPRDRLAIEAALARYSYGLDQRAWHEWDDLFAPDAVLDYTGIGLGELTPAQFREHVSHSDPTRIAGQHLHANTLVTVDGDTAVARAEFTMVNLTRSDEPGRAGRVQAGGSVRFDLVRTGSGWRIARRSATTKWIERDDLPWSG